MWWEMGMGYVLTDLSLIQTEQGGWRLLSVIDGS